MSNLNEIKPKKVKIVLDKERYMVLTLNTFAAMEEKYGSIEAAFKAAESGSVIAARFLLWQCLLEDDPTLTEKQVGSMLTMDKMVELTEYFQESMNLSLPDMDKVKQMQEAQKAQGIQPLPTPNK